MVTARAIMRLVRQTLLVIFITLVLAEIAFRIYNYINPSFVSTTINENAVRSYLRGGERC
ncbi:MAG TPA: hypothetical protein VKN18_19485 [Blastocatellia bacterium]|nr:hypothetical protein [Blastocatellia bacterium]